MNKYQSIFRKGCRSIDMAIEKAIIKEEESYMDSIDRPLMYLCMDGLHLTLPSIGDNGPYRKCWDISDFPVKYSLIDHLRCADFKKESEMQIPLLSDVINLDHWMVDLDQTA